MPDRELVLRVRCDCGYVCDTPYCPGGSETVLDPERVLVFSWWSGAKEFQVIDVLDALGGSDE